MHDEPHLAGRMRTAARAALAAASLCVCALAAAAAEGSDGKALLQKNCGRCHAVAAGAASTLRQAPNLWDKLTPYPGERLETELSEGIGSHHEKMPQIQFSSEDIESIYDYLHPGNE